MEWWLLEAGGRRKWGRKLKLITQLNPLFNEYEVFIRKKKVWNHVERDCDDGCNCT